VVAAARAHLAEDPRRDIRRIADECGTSTAIIHRHDLHELDTRHELSDAFSFDGAVRDARRALDRSRPGSAAGRPA
jgi:hypothetical protein